MGNVMEYDLAIIGGGPAGMSAAIYAGRLGMKTAVFESKLLGGNMCIAHVIENYPGFERISGMELAEKMKAQVTKAGAEIIEEGIVEVRKMNSEFDMTTDRRKTHKAKAIILATGGEYRKLGIEGEEMLIGRGVSYCPNCDGPLFKGKNIAIIGGGHHAVYGALYLAGLAKNLYIINAKKELQAEEVMVKQLNEMKNCQIFNGYAATEIVGKDLVEKIRIQEVENSATKEIAVEGIFICIGEIPLVTLARSLGVGIDSKGCVSVDQNSSTNVPGVFAAGDVTGGVRQIIAAAGAGAVASINALRYVQSLKYKK